MNAIPMIGRCMQLQAPHLDPTRDWTIAWTSNLLVKSEQDPKSCLYGPVLALKVDGWTPYFDAQAL